MARKIKVFGTIMMAGDWAECPTYHRQVTVIMACTNRRRFEAATGVTPDYISETGNHQQLQAALDKPGRLLYLVAKRPHTSGIYKEVPDEGYHHKWLDYEGRANDL